MSASLVDRNIRHVGSRHVEEMRDIGRDLTEKALHMRAVSYLSDVKASLLTQTIFSMKESKSGLVSEVSRRQILERELVEAKEQAEKALQSRNTILNTAAVSIAMTVEGRFTWVNDHMVNLLGYSQAELIGRTPAFLYADPEDFHRVELEGASQRDSERAVFEKKPRTRDRRAKNQAQAEARRRQKRLEELETLITIQEEKLAAISLSLENPPADQKKVQKLGEDYVKMQSSLDALMAEWETLHE